MARRIFFSFHYADIWRVMQVRNAWAVRARNETAGFIDKADFEAVERKGRVAIERWIDSQLEGTSATVVLIGKDTADREYVRYEIEQSYERGNRLLGIWIDNIKDANGRTAWWRGENPFESVYIGGFLFGSSVSSLLKVPIYDWVKNDGRNNISRWIENAPRLEFELQAR